MFAELFESAPRIQALRHGPGGPLLGSFTRALLRSGYAPLTTRRHLRAAEHFAHWADHRGTVMTAPVGRALERFSRHLQCPGRCPFFGHKFQLEILHGARLFLTHLQDIGVIEAPVVEGAAPSSPLITAFCQWMRQQRGTCTSTLSNYELHLREFLKRVGDQPGKWDARSVREFVLEGSRRCGWASAKKRTTKGHGRWVVT